MDIQKAHLLRRLYSYARNYRAEVILATLYSVLNKFFDVLPEVLIGVVVNQEQSFLVRSTAWCRGVPA